jgi:hypothetical protein
MIAKFVVQLFSKTRPNASESAKNTKIENFDKKSLVL